MKISARAPCPPADPNGTRHRAMNTRCADANEQSLRATWRTIYRPRRHLRKAGMFTIEISTKIPNSAGGNWQWDRHLACRVSAGVENDPLRSRHELPLPVCGDHPASTVAFVL